MSLGGEEFGRVNKKKRRTRKALMQVLRNQDVILRLLSADPQRMPSPLDQAVEERLLETQKLLEKMQ